MIISDNQKLTLPHIMKYNKDPDYPTQNKIKKFKFDANKKMVYYYETKE